MMRAGAPQAPPLHRRLDQRSIILFLQALSRTFKEYGTYVDELHTEKQRLATMEVSKPLAPSGALR